MGHRRALPTGLALLALVGCGGSEQAPYFPADASTNVVMLPIAASQTAVTGLNRIEARPGDRIELIDAAPVDPQGGGTVIPFVLLMSETGGGGIGAVELSAEWDAGRTVADVLVPLDVFVLTDDIGVVQVVLATAPDGPGRVTWDRSRITFKADGSERSQDWPYGARVCAADPPPDACPETESEPSMTPGA